MPQIVMRGFTKPDGMVQAFWDGLEQELAGRWIAFFLVDGFLRTPQNQGRPSDEGLDWGCASRFWDEGVRFVDLHDVALRDGLPAVFFVGPPLPRQRGR